MDPDRRVVGGIPAVPDRVGLDGGADLDGLLRRQEEEQKDARTFYNALYSERTLK